MWIGLLEVQNTCEYVPRRNVVVRIVCVDQVGHIFNNWGWIHPLTGVPWEWKSEGDLKFQEHFPTPSQCSEVDPQAPWVVESTRGMTWTDYYIINFNLTNFFNTQNGVLRLKVVSPQIWGVTSPVKVQSSCGQSCSGIYALLTMWDWWWERFLYHSLVCHASIK